MRGEGKIAHRLIADGNVEVTPPIPALWICFSHCPETYRIHNRDLNIVRPTIKLGSYHYTNQLFIEEINRPNEKYSQSRFHIIYQMNQR